MSTDRYSFFRKSYAVGVDGNFIDCLKSQPSSKRLRWPFGRHDRQSDAIVGWFATPTQIYANNRGAVMGDGKYILVENEEAVDAVQARIGNDPEFLKIMEHHDIKQRWFFRSRNKRRAWDKFGRETVA